MKNIVEARYKVDLFVSVILILCLITACRTGPWFCWYVMAFLIYFERLVFHFVEKRCHDAQQNDDRNVITGKHHPIVTSRSLEVPIFGWITQPQALRYAMIRTGVVVTGRQTIL